MTEIIRLVVIDDHPLLLDGLISTLDSVNDFDVAGQGENYTDAVNLAHELVPDTILLDISMPGGGVEAARDIHAALPSIIIIILTASEDEKDVISALQAGASAYVLKGIAGKELIDIVRKVSSGETFITPSLAGSILSHSYANQPNSNETSDLLDKLNDRESRILSYLEQGFTNKQIGDALFLSEKTIKHYMTSILQKLQVKNRVQAALLATKK
ncbi:MAG TPA: response regulator transcription factor [Leucothrix mucor]|uniref:Response regulator transcription factor n=1 Tax=Leucothrix mucor TaxID=45248 RepID=A0A7V2T1Z4_LEUMU|nr:response regulator transcription factor [Leucothrix mucor]